MKFLRTARMLGFLCLVCAACGQTEGARSPDPASPGDSEAPAAVVGGAGIDGGAPVAPGPSRCQVFAASALCTQRTRAVSVGLWVSRDVHYELPLGAAPAAGWPVVIMFQGSGFPATHTFYGTTTEPFGAYYQTGVVKALLDAGYAILAPDAHLLGSTYWDTNIPPWADHWSNSPDNQFMVAVFAAIEQGQFGPLNKARMYATGISSGGYMTSRMAVSYPGRFRALAIASGSYATCSALCVLPSALPANHPPTLFLHGRQDPLVPLATMESYRNLLDQRGFATRTIIRDSAGHEWLPEAPSAVLDWFVTHPRGPQALRRRRLWSRSSFSRRVSFLSAASRRRAASVEEDRRAGRFDADPAWSSGYIDLANHCGRTVRVKVAWDAGPDSACTTIYCGAIDITIRIYKIHAAAIPT